MISPGWLVLLVGFDLSALMAAYSDAVHRGVRDFVWLPALVSAAYFFWGGWLPGLLLVLILDAVVLVVTVVVLKLGSKGVGQADVIGLAVFGLWPSLLFTCVALASLCVFALNIRHRYIPQFRFVGWMSAFVIPVGLWLLYQGGAL
ncbi:MAG: prepilin peptidase [Euryarchaeota archaeon]|nr:prepilin peptidase [Euryarchaeota archaeon]